MSDLDKFRGINPPEIDLISKKIIPYDENFDPSPE